MKFIFNKFARLFLECLERPMTQDEWAFLAKIHTHQREAIENLKIRNKKLQTALDEIRRKNEIDGRHTRPLNERYLEHSRLPCSKSRITINPCSGRVSLKVAEKASEDDYKDYLILAKKVLRCEDFLPFTYRGRIAHYEGVQRSLTIKLNTERKIHPPLLISLNYAQNDEKSFGANGKE